MGGWSEPMITLSFSRRRREIFGFDEMLHTKITRIITTYYPEIDEGYAERERNVVLLLESANCLNHGRMTFHFRLVSLTVSWIQQFAFDEREDRAQKLSMILMGSSSGSSVEGLQPLDVPSPKQ